MSLKIFNGNIDVITINVIEYFKNDPNVIRDFLSLTPSPWDTLFMIKNNINVDELKAIKDNVLDNLVNKKLDRMINEYDDADISDDIYSKEEVYNLFNTDEECTHKIIESYMFDIAKKYNVNISLFNFFKSYIEDLLQDYIYNLESFDLEQTSIDNTFLSELSPKHKPFIKKEAKDFIKYIENNIPEENVNLFIGYLLSIIYAYIRVYIDNVEDIEIDDSVFVDILDSDIDYKEYLINSPELIVRLVDHLNDLYSLYPHNYDLRKQIKDDVIQSIFNNIDPYYNSYFEDTVLLNDITIEDKLDKVMRMFKDNDLVRNNDIDYIFSNDQIIDYLEGIHSMYSSLLSVGLDARFEEYYSTLIIKKYVSDVYEYLGYIRTLDNSFDVEYLDLYEEIQEIDYDWKSIYGLFYDNYSIILDLWYRYANKDINFHIKAWLEAKNNGDYKTIININSFAVYRFSKLQNTKELQSVDCMNNILRQMSTGSYEFGENAHDICNIICLNIYERLLTLEDYTLEQKKLLDLFNNSDNLPEYLDKHQTEFWKIINLFDKINPTEVDYIKECNIRNNIKSEEHIKTLKKLNPFNE